PEGAPAGGIFRKRAPGTTVLPAPRLGLVVPGTPPDAARSCGRDHRTGPVIPPVTGDPRQQLGRCDRVEGLPQTTETGGPGWVEGAYAAGRGGGQPTVRMTASSSESAHRWMS